MYNHLLVCKKNKSNSSENKKDIVLDTPVLNMDIIEYNKILEKKIEELKNQINDNMIKIPDDQYINKGLIYRSTNRIDRNPAI